MATFITDRTETDVNKAKELMQKVAITPWASLTPTEQNTFLNTNVLYEDKGRFGTASASRIATYLDEITAMDSRFTAWSTKNFQGSFDYTIGTPAYKPINREHLKDWVQILKLAYAGNPVNWDFDTKPYLNYEILNRMESLSEAYYNGDVSIQSEKCGMYHCGETFDTFYNLV